MSRFPTLGGHALLIAALTLAGCCQTRPETVTVTLPAPPPTVVTHSDTVLVTLPPVVLPPDTVETVVTVPEVVTVYREPRPDTSSAFRLHGFTLTRDALTLHGTRASHRFRAPERGETLHGASLSPERVEARIEGTPEPDTLAVTVPACPEPEEPLIPRGLWGWLQLVGLVLVSAAAGFVFRSLMPR